MSHCFTHRLPRAGLDRIDGPTDALSLLRLGIQCPPVPDTVVLLLDHVRRGIAIAAVRGTHGPDDVIEVAECFAGVAAEQADAGALVIASIRPGAPSPDPDDVDRWLEMSELTELLGVELVEWFVLGRSTWCPRDLLGEQPRW